MRAAESGDARRAECRCGPLSRVAPSVRQRADIGLAGFLYREDRAAVVDYADLVPVFTGDYEFLVRRGAPATARLSAEVFHSLLRPLHSSVWLVLRESAPLRLAGPT